MEKAVMADASDCRHGPMRCDRASVKEIPMDVQGKLPVQSDRGCNHVSGCAHDLVREIRAVVAHAQVICHVSQVPAADVLDLVGEVNASASLRGAHATWDKATYL